MTTRLPSRPNLQHLKDEAKSLLKAHRKGNPSCCEVLRHLKELRDKPDDQLLASKLSLASAQHAIALEYGFKTWAELKLSVLGRTDSGAFMHLLCGDQSGQILRNSSVPGDVQVWMETFIDGPVPRDVSESEWRMVRAKYLASLFSDPLPVDPEQAGLRYERLKEGRNYREVLLWFDACMFDQTIMIHLIDRLSRLDLGDAKLSLICPGEFPGFDTFHGFALLTPEQMASLLETRHEVTEAEITLARAAWRAFSSPDPTEIEQVLSGDCSALPYLSAALTRFLQQYPSAANGLSRLETELLTAVASGAEGVGAISAMARDMEARPYFHDMTIVRAIEDLASAETPLLAVSDLKRMSALNKVDRQEQSNREMTKWRISITDAGRAVLAGKRDHVKLNGIDRWLGGGHLQGREPQWRWNAGRGRLAEAPTDRSEQDRGIPPEAVDRPLKAVKAEADSARNTRIMYLELKTHPGGHDDRGPAWIGRVRFSKTGRTLYYRGTTLQRTKGPIGCGNFVDVDSDQAYWVSGPKRNGEDRHWNLGSPVNIDDDVREKYWTDIRKQPENINKRTA